MTEIVELPKKSPSLTGNVVRGIGRAFRFIRETILNILVLLLLIAIISALLSGDEGDHVPSDAVLVLNPSGSLVEQETFSDPILDLIFSSSMPVETSIHKIVRTLEYAATDDRVQLLVLDFSRLLNVDFAELERLQGALLDFNASGKKVWAHATSYSQGTYLLAMVADRVLMDPMGDLIFSGVSASTTYYKDLLDKLKVDVNVYAAGEYKTAVEPYTRTDMSDAARLVNSKLVDALWQRLIQRVTAARDIKEERFVDYATRLHELLESRSAGFAQLAVEFGFVDALVTQSELKDEYREEISPDSQTIGYYSYLPHIEKPSQFGNPKIAVIVIEGEILGIESTVTGESSSWVKQVERATKDRSYEALVVRVNSPGGSVIESENIRRALVKFKDSGRPIVASFSGTAASGGYWVALPANQIVATPVTITGSIGVFGLYPSIENALQEIGISTDVIRTTPFGLATSAMVASTDAVHKLRSLMVKRYYDRFINLVAAARNKPVKDIEAIAEGRIWLGEDALELGLVDELGDFEVALAKAAELADLSEYRVEFLQRDINFFMPLGNLASKLKRTLVELLHPLDALSGSVNREIDYVRDPSDIYARCQDCGLQIW